MCKKVAEPCDGANGAEPLPRGWGQCVRRGSSWVVRRSRAGVRAVCGFAPPTGPTHARMFGFESFEPIRERQIPARVDFHAPLYERFEFRDFRFQPPNKVAGSNAGCAGHVQLAIGGCWRRTRHRSAFSLDAERHR